MFLFVVWMQWILLVKSIQKQKDQFILCCLIKYQVTIIKLTIFYLLIGNFTPLLMLISLQLQFTRHQFNITLNIHCRLSNNGIYFLWYELLINSYQFIPSTQKLGDAFLHHNINVKKLQTSMIITHLQNSTNLLSEQKLTQFFIQRLKLEPWSSIFVLLITKYFS